MKSKSILIADDDEDILDVVNLILCEENYKVQKAKNGEEALSYLKSLSPSDLPDCILLDLMMPVMDGVKFMKILEEDYPDTLAQIPILISTAKGSPLVSGISLPHIRYIKKPMNLTELLEAIRESSEAKAS